MVRTSQKALKDRMSLQRHGDVLLIDIKAHFGEATQIRTIATEKLGRVEASDEAKELS